MEVLQGIESIKETHKHAVVVLGFFDGFHKGHQALIKETKRVAETLGSPVLVYTFDRHPLEVVDPPRAPFLLATVDEKIELARFLGIDYFLIGEFNESLSRLEPTDFLREIVKKKLEAKHVMAGFNYRYGKGHGGNAGTLLRDAKQLSFPVTIVEAVMAGGQPVSSTRIRRLLLEGNVAEATPLLGRPYLLRGKVVKGDGRGKALGVPTANMEIPPRKLIPRIGIYAGIAKVDEEKFGGVVSIGRRPTFGGGGVVVEVYLLDFDGNLYGKTISVELVSWIRDEEKFASADALVEKMKEDIREGRARLEGVS